MEADNISNHENEYFKFFGEHTIVAPPRPGFREALIEKISNKYINSNNNFSFSTLAFKSLYLSSFFLIIFLGSFFLGTIVLVNNLNFNTLTSRNRVASTVSYSEGILQKMDKSGNWEDIKGIEIFER